jgi:hypothetical protein
MTDASLQYSQKQAVTATAVSDAVIDHGVDKIGDVNPVFLEVDVNAAFVTANGGTLQAVLQDSADGTTFRDVISSRVFAAADLSAGARLFRGSVPYGIRRYTRMNYIVGTGAFTAGTVSAFLEGRE